LEIEKESRRMEEFTEFAELERMQQVWEMFKAIANASP
jgi:hypothetical protein